MFTQILEAKIHHDGLSACEFWRIRPLNPFHTVQCSGKYEQPENLIDLIYRISLIGWRTFISQPRVKQGFFILKTPFRALALKPFPGNK